MKKGLLLLFPGVRYGVDCPLLYYTRLSYTYAGYEILPIDDYGTSEDEDLTAYAKQAVQSLKSRLKEIDFKDYEHVVFAEKSIGTVIGPMLEDEMSADNITHIIYTPLDATFAFLNPDRRIVGCAAGTSDKHIEIKALRAACKKLSIPLVEIKNGGHRLESGKDVTKDISTIAQVIAQIGDPASVEKLAKRIEAEKAAAEKEAAAKALAAAKAEADAKAKAAEKAPAGKQDADKPTSSKSAPKKKKEGSVRLFKSNGKNAERELESMMEIWLQSNVKEQSFIPKKYWSKNYKEVMRVMSIATVYMYEEGDQIIGFVASMEEAIVAICVSEENRDRGIGSKLLKTLQDDLVFLEASVYTKNKRAMEFFNKNEFKPKDIQIEASTGQEIVLLSW